MTEESTTIMTPGIYYAKKGAGKLQVERKAKELIGSLGEIAILKVVEYLASHPKLDKDQKPIKEVKLSANDVSKIIRSLGLNACLRHIPQLCRMDAEEANEKVQQTQTERKGQKKNKPKAK